MTGGGRGASQPEPSRDRAPQPEDLREVLEQLRGRLQDVAAWAEHASHPGAGGGVETAARAEEEGAREPEVTATHSDPDGRRSPQGENAPVETLPLDFLRRLARSGAVTGGVFSNGYGIIDLTESRDAAKMPESGLVALLNLVPSDTVLEVRTTSAELRAARLGDDSFAVEVTPGCEQEVDDWLASLLPKREG